MVPARHSTFSAADPPTRKQTSRHGRLIAVIASIRAEVCQASRTRNVGPKTLLLSLALPLPLPLPMVQQRWQHYPA